MQHISCNTGSRALPDIVRTRPQALRALWHRAYISGNALQPVLQLLHVVRKLAFTVAVKYSALKHQCTFSFLHILYIIYIIQLDIYSTIKQCITWVCSVRWCMAGGIKNVLIMLSEISQNFPYCASSLFPHYVCIVFQG